MNKRIGIIFFLVLFIGFFLRIYNVGEIPPGVNRDEASIGYTAYSLLTTGKDEYGISSPFSFQSFGDWKLPLYIYVTLLSVSLLGLNEFAVRIPSVLFGTGVVFLTYFLIQELFGNKRLSLITMFLVAVSPWSLHLSRVESESNTAVFLITLAVVLFLKGIKRNTWYLVVSAIFFSLTYFTYAGNYIFTTLLVSSLVLIYRKEIPRKKETVFAALVFLLLSISVFSVTLFANRTKVSGIGIFGDPSVVHAKIELPRNEHEDPGGLAARVFHNRVIFAGERFFQNYLSAFSAEFLFIKGGENKAHNIENFGNMYLVEAPFLFLGIFSLLFFKKGKEKWLVLSWLLIGPVAASITKDAPHTNRMFAIFPMLSLFVAIGYQQSIEWVRVRWKKMQLLVAAFIALLLIINIGMYLDRYYVHFPKNEEQNWGASYKNLSNVLTSKPYESKQVVISKPEHSPYIFLLFYQAFSPKEYQAGAVRYPPTEDGFVHVKGFGRYIFREIDWEKDLKIPNALLVDDSSKVPESVTAEYPVTYIVLPNGKPIFTLIETK